ncbi:MAG: CpaF family protein [Candidatus Paceibacterota bacterium]
MSTISDSGDLSKLFPGDGSSSDISELFTENPSPLGLPIPSKGLANKSNPSNDPSKGTFHTNDTANNKQEKRIYRPNYSYQSASSPMGKIHAGGLDRRHTDSERLWPIVDRILAVAGSDARVQQKASLLELTRDLEQDAHQRDDVLSVLRNRLGVEGIKITDPSDIPPVLQMVYDELVGLSVLGDLWRDPDITEIMVDRWDHIVIERNGRLESTNYSFRSPDHAQSVARSLAQRVSHRALSRSINLVTAELPQARVQFAYGPVVKGGLAISIRKFSKLLTLEDLIAKGALNTEMESFLRDCVIHRAGILVSGGTGTGKTTIINLLSSFIPENERVVTIEDAFELQLSNLHVVSLQTKEASSADDSVSVTLAQLLRATLRMRPDRIIVGEIREGEGAEVMLAAANTGHEGTMTTIHANSVDMAVNERIVDLVRQVRLSGDDAIKRTVSSAFDIVLQVERGRKGNRYISEISQVDRAFITKGSISPEIIFKGVDNGDGTATFTRNGSVKKDSSLSNKMAFSQAAVRWCSN